jgi:protein-S-isoprenylcysteine O-methyltransferase Ste14
VAIPPLIYGAFLLLGLALDFLFPVSVLPSWARYFVGLPLIAASFAIAIPAIRHFREAGTNLDVRKPTTTVVATGPFRYSRNPIYFAMTVLYIGLGIAAGSLWILGLVLPTLMVMHIGVIAREERYLERKFGEEYLTYKRAVRRWI